MMMVANLRPAANLCREAVYFKILSLLSAVFTANRKYQWMPTLWIYRSICPWLLVVVDQFRPGRVSIHAHPSIDLSKTITGHSKTRTSVQLGILLGLSGDGMEGGGGGAAAMGYWEGGGGAVLCINSANQMHKGLYRCFLLKYPKKYLRPPTPPPHFQVGQK